MSFTFIQLGFLIVSCFFSGVILAYFLFKRKLSSIKEELIALRRSLAGMWDSNENWKKKYDKLEKEKLNQNNKTEKQKGKELAA